MMMEEISDISELDLKKNEVIKGWVKCYLTTEVNSDFKRLTAPAFSHGVGAILAKLYKESGEEYKKALQRHLVFYNSGATWGSVTFGMTCALEEKRAIILQEEAGSEELEASADIVSNLKADLIEPLTGVGDTINHGVFHPLPLPMFILLAAEGNWLAGVGPLLIWGVTVTFLAYTLITKGCILGRKSVVSTLKSGKLNQFIRATSVLGLFMIGVLSFTYVELVTPIPWASAADEKQLLQGVLDKIFSNILPLLVVFGIHFYIKKSGLKHMHTLVSILVLSVILSSFSIV